MSNYVDFENMKAILQGIAPKIGGGGGGTATGDTPIGTVISYMGTTAPVDYLICDGTLYNISQYNDLANFIKQQFGSYNFFGGDGTTTFAVPDLQGEFLRGSGTNSHTNQGSGASVGVHQDATEHNVFVTGITQDPVLTVRGVDGSNYKQLDTNNRDSVISTLIAQQFIASSSISSSQTADGFYTSRPTNTSVLYCIKYNTSILSTPENNYSTEEQRIGTWIDGKPLYQITIQDTMPEITTDGTRTTKTIDVSSLKIAFGVHFTGVLVHSGYTVELDSASLDTAIRFGSFNKNVNDYDTLFLATNIVSDSNNPVYITLQYTKTTD